MPIHNPSQRWQVALAPLLTVLAACAPDPVPDSGELSGQDVFDESCAACHGKEGLGPSLEHLRSLSSAELRAGIMNHPTAGQIQERLRADRVDKLIKYLDESP